MMGADGACVPDLPTRPTVTGRPQVGAGVALMVDEFDQPFTVAHYFPSGTRTSTWLRLRRLHGRRPVAAGTGVRGPGLQTSGP